MKFFNKRKIAWEYLHKINQTAFIEFFTFHNYLGWNLWCPLVSIIKTPFITVLMWFPRTLVFKWEFKSKKYKEVESKLCP